jgi:leucyl/phenylalanyl-tRNA---protein transferase
MDFGTLRQGLQHWALGLLWSLKPPRLFGVPAVLLVLARHYAGFRPPPGVLPDPEKTWPFTDGLAGICTDMSVPTLKVAYVKGLFPLAHVGLQKWWAPRERMVCFPDSIHVSKNLRRLLRNKRFEVTFDTAFDAVIEACGEPRPGRWHITWIRPDIIAAYRALHAAGYAHSVEVWDEAGTLVGGLYGVAVGKAFFTESMFSRQPETSKIGFVVLSCHLRKWGFMLNDGKRETGHLRSLGFRLISRAKFNALLAEACRLPGKEGRWEVDKSIDVSRWEPSAGLAKRPDLAKQLPL